MRTNIAMGLEYPNILIHSFCF